MDDEVRGTELLCRTLAEVGTVLVANSVSEACAQLETNRVDLVVTDQRMPGGTGVDLLEKVATMDPAVGRILLTAYADQEATVGAINRGQVHAYLHKPCMPEQLLVTARTILERVRLWRENQQLLDEASEHARTLEATLAELRDAQDRMVHAERLSAIGRMTAMVVHDLRGPISLIRSAAGELTEAPDTLGEEAIREVGESVRTESDRLERLCAELLDTTRHSDASSPMEPAPLDDVVSQAVTFFTRDAVHQGVEVDLQLRSDRSLPMREEALRRALGNLVCNALEVMPEGGLLRVRTEADEDGARIIVTDSGPGVPDSIRDQVFEPFVTAGKPSGIGLGLAIVKKVVEDHGGRISLSKPPGGGASFEIRLPAS
ncbi:MAG: hybrid sensor histidine kinase/response regulator [Myxococcota bacterium]|nr:hybrid sensor histidine kinase/response regulator [Myxococcota bacterium]